MTRCPPLTRGVNRVLERRLGVRVSRVLPPAPPPPPPPPLAPAPPVRRPARADDRLVPDPVFIISPVRSGSTLLRMMLNSHSQICAPHETHFRRLSVGLGTESVQLAMTAFDLNQRDLEHLLWDRLLHRALVSSGKRVLVEKTPSNAFVVNRLATAWPGARFIYLLRHPYSIARSWHDGDPVGRPMELAVSHTSNFMRHVERARTQHAGLALRYERLVADPAGETARVCEFLGVPWEAGMLDYGEGQNGEFVKGLGDWRDKIRSGTVQLGRELPDTSEVPEALQEYCAAWSY